MIIVVSGPPGSGKTTHARLIADYLGYNYYSAGSIFRSIAEERRLTLEELSRIAASDPSIDLEIDKRTLNLASSRDNIVIDGHLTSWILAYIADIKILITASLKTRIHRIAMRDGKSLHEAFEETITREYYQWRRFIEYYGLETNNTSFFDLVVNTDNLTKEETFNIIKGFLEKVLKTRRSVKHV